MPMCPVCGTRIWRAPHPDEEIVCSQCGFRLHRKRDASGILTRELEVVEQPLSETEAEEKWRREHPEYYAPSPREEVTLRPQERAKTRHAIKRSSSKRAATPTPRVKVKARKQLSQPAQEVSRCMVCNLELRQRDDVVLCPHCHKLAHRNHLIEWLHIKKHCPACGKELGEEYYK